MAEDVLFAELRRMLIEQLDNIEYPDTTTEKRVECVIGVLRAFGWGVVVVCDGGGENTDYAGDMERLARQIDDDAKAIIAEDKA